MARCRACGAPIAFVKTPKGRFVPVDLEPVLVVRRGSGQDTVITDKGEIIRGFRVDEQPDPEYGAHQGRIPHWAMCTEPDRFRRNNE